MKKISNDNRAQPSICIIYWMISFSRIKNKRPFWLRTRTQSNRDTHSPISFFIFNLSIIFSCIKKAKNPACINVTGGFVNEPFFVWLENVLANRAEGNWGKTGKRACNDDIVVGKHAEPATEEKRTRWKGHDRAFGIFRSSFVCFFFLLLEYHVCIIRWLGLFIGHSGSVQWPSSGYVILYNNVL